MNKKGISSVLVVLLVALVVGIVGYFSLSGQSVAPTNQENDLASSTESGVSSSVSVTPDLSSQKPITTPPPTSSVVATTGGKNSLKDVDTHDWAVIFDPETVRVGDLAGVFKVSYVAPINTYYPRSESNFDIKFSGQGTITGEPSSGVSEMTGSFCFKAIDAQSKNLLPRTPHKGTVLDSVHFCFTNTDVAMKELLGKRKATIVVDNFRAKSYIPDDAPNLAEFVKLISFE